MCGIAGFIDVAGRSGDLHDTLGRMTSAIAHRGPDDEGQWVDDAAGVALGHRRLSIIDVSPTGHQPMMSASGRYVIVYNGEIYNHQEVRRTLDNADATPAVYRGRSDTEIILAAVETWGLRAALERFVGMFAFALWDRHDRVLHLVRDRLGEKPLYYGWAGDTLLFASELKAMRAHPQWQGQIDEDAVALMMRYSYIPAPHCIYKGIFKLRAATVLSLRSPYRRALASPVTYWSAKSVYEAAAADPFQGSDETATRELDTVLRRAVADQMIADVPVGAFLSSGIDSSLIVSLMQAQSHVPVRTFTIGSHDKAYNEAENAKRIARHLGTEHTELYVTAEDALAVIPTLPAIYDEPFADPSQIPTCLVSMLTRQHVTVSLSGDGGDELFCGYHRYLLLQQLWHRVGWMPAAVRRAVARSLAQLAPAVDSLERLEPALPPVVRRFAVRFPKRAQWLTSQSSPEALYRDCVSHWKAPATPRSDSAEPLSALTDPQQWAALPGLLDRAMFIDLIGYLPDDILVKVDRATMSVGLESRAPFLDHRVVEFAARLPLTFKMRRGQSKWLLREVLRQYVPDALVEGPKRGFLIGFSQWLRGPLREWAEALLDETRLRADGFFDPALVRAKWTQYLSDASSPWNNDLWNILMFQSWLESSGEPSVRNCPRPGSSYVGVSTSYER